MICVVYLGPQWIKNCRAYQTRLFTEHLLFAGRGRAVLPVVLFRRPPLTTHLLSPQPRPGTSAPFPCRSWNFQLIPADARAGAKQ